MFSRRRTTLNDSNLFSKYYGKKFSPKHGCIGLQPKEVHLSGETLFATNMDLSSQLGSVMMLLEYRYQIAPSAALRTDVIDTTV